MHDVLFLHYGSLISSSHHSFGQTTCAHSKKQANTCSAAAWTLTVYWSLSSRKERTILEEKTKRNLQRKDCLLSTVGFVLRSTLLSLLLTVSLGKLPTAVKSEPVRAHPVGAQTFDSNISNADTKPNRPLRSSPRRLPEVRRKRSRQTDSSHAESQGRSKKPRMALGSLRWKISGLIPVRQNAENLNPNPPALAARETFSDVKGGKNDRHRQLTQTRLPFSPKYALKPWCDPHLTGKNLLVILEGRMKIGVC